MTTGTQADVLARLKAVLPTGWLPAGASPIADAALSAGAYVGSLAYGLIQFARAQMRLQTASGGWLDLFAFDYFQRNLPRGALSDTAYAALIKQQLLPGGATRPAMAAALTNLTGRAPVITEGFRPADTGALNGGPVAIGYGSGGRYGTRAPGVAFIIAYRGNSVPDATIYATVASIKAEGIQAFVAISN